MAIDLSQIPTLISLLGDTYGFFAKDEKLAKKLMARRGTKKLKIKHILALIEMQRLLLDELENEVKTNERYITIALMYLLDSFDSLALAYSNLISNYSLLNKVTSKEAELDELLDRVLSEEISERITHQNNDKQE